MIEKSLMSVELIREETAWTLVLARPEMNILDLGLIDELDSAVRDAAEAGIPTLVLRARGRCFSAGVDVRDHTPDKVDRMLRSFDGLLSRIVEYPGCVISVVEGPALGGGCELACMCDLVLATERATFGLPEIRLGVFPPAAMTFFPRLIGLRRAAELILTGRTLTAREAAEIGLISQSVAPEALDLVLEDLLGRARSLSPAVVRLTKKTMRSIEVLPWRDSLALVEETYRNDLMRLPDSVEGLRAFMEKRPPKWEANPRRES